MTKEKEDLDRKISQKIDSYTKNQDKEIEEEIEQDIKEVVSKEIKERVDKEVREEFLLNQDLGQQQNVSRLKRQFWQIKACMSGICFFQLIIIMFAYLSIIVLMFSCVLFDFFFCIDRSILGSGTIISLVSIMSLIITVGLSFFF